MSRENTLYEDDFDVDFGDDLDSTLSDVLTGSDDVAEEPEPKAPRAPRNSVGQDSDSGDGGIATIPAISIHVFCETAKTANLVKSVAADRRMAQTSMEIHQGGLESAIGFLSENLTPNLLILESSASSKKMLAQIDELAGYCDEGVQVMVIGATNDITLYRHLIARGVSEYMVPPFQPVQMVKAISRLFADPDAPFTGKSISVMGVKGGVGASTLAHNLAWSLSENAHVNTALVDLDLSFGTTSLAFDMDSAQTVADALLAPERVDAAVVSKLLAKATERLSLFTAPGNVNTILEIPSESYNVVINAVRSVMPFVVLDLPHAWNNWTFETLVGSDEVVLVCQPDLASLRNGKNIIDQLSAQRPNDAPPRLIINMSGVPKRPEIPLRDFTAAIGVQPELVLPFEPQLFGEAMNNGQMLAETAPNADVTQSIDKLASTLTGREIARQETSFLSKLLRKKA